MKKEMKDIENEWKKLRGKIEIDLNEGEEEVKEVEQKIHSEQFTDFLQGSVGFRAPILEKVEHTKIKEQAQIPSLEDLGNLNESPFDSTLPTNPNIQNKPVYLPDTDNVYKQISQNVQSTSLRPRDTMPVSQIPRHELLDSNSSMSARDVRSTVYPDLLEPEETKETGKRYYKVTR